MKNKCNKCDGTGRVEAVGADCEGETDFCLWCYGTGVGDEPGEVIAGPFGIGLENVKLKPSAKAEGFSPTPRTGQ